MVYAEAGAGRRELGGAGRRSWEEPRRSGEEGGRSGRTTHGRTDTDRLMQREIIAGRYDDKEST